MRDRVFLGGRPLAERAAPGRLPVRLEDRVVAEAAAAARRGRDPAAGRATDEADRHGIARAGTGARRREREHAHVPRAAAFGREAVKLGEELRVVVEVGRGRSRVPPGPHAGSPVEGVDLETGVVGEGRQPGPPRTEPGLDPGVRRERLAGLLGVVGDAQVVEADELAALEPEELAQLAELVDRVGRDEEARTRHRPTRHRRTRHRRTVARISVWAANRRSSPDEARSISPSIACRSNGLPSAVPWTSTNVPASVPTTLKSTSARESSL
jgi:hypothetical protein